MKDFKTHDADKNYEDIKKFSKHTDRNALKSVKRHTLQIKIARTHSFHVCENDTIQDGGQDGCKKKNANTGTVDTLKGNYWP